MTAAMGAMRPVMIGLGGAVLGMAIAGALAFWWQGRTVAALRGEAERLRLENAALAEAGAMKAAAVEQLKAEMFQAEAAVSFKRQETEALHAAMRALKRRMREVTGREAFYDTRLSPDVADALCMQYKTANRYAIQGDTGSPAGLSDGDAADSLAAGCGGWRQLTLRNALAWSGMLLERIGEDAGSFRALNAWREGVSEMGKTDGCLP